MKEEEIRPGISIIGFDSFEEMDEYMSSHERDASTATMAEQWAIGWGGYVFRLHGDLAIFGRILTEEEFLDLNSGPKGPDQEVLDELETLRASHDRGYRYGRWYSMVEPEGEYGSAHVVSLWPITQLDFEEARRNDWHLGAKLLARLAAETEEAVTNHERKHDAGQD